MRTLIVKGQSKAGKPMIDTEEKSLASGRKHGKKEGSGEVES